MRLQLMLNIFNLADAKTVIGVNQTTGRSFSQPTASISNGVVRFSTRFTF
jgi:hypothetical protein